MDAQRASKPDTQTYAIEEMVAFVGQKVFVREVDNFREVETTLEDGRKVTTRIPGFDQKFEARYNILDIVSGSYMAPDIDFVAYDHYGRPAFEQADTVMLFLIKVDEKWFHWKYLYYDVRPTDDNDWGICGSAARYDFKADIADGYVEPLTFRLPHSTLASTDPLPCTRGTRVANIVKYQTEARFDPEHRRKRCNIEIGVSSNTLAGTGSHPEAKAERDAHEACVQDLEARNWP